jgi:CubicO group peptidase (beta-lactamase class C family)
VDVDRWQARLDELAAEHDVPAVSLAVLADGAVTAIATGVLSRRTGVGATVDALFQIGSITKVYTATVLLRLVEQGRLDLDTPVADLLPGFRVADPEITAGVTPRHLLSHTSGIDGDFFHDTGRGDDCLARYVEACAGLGRTHPLGRTMSYSNTGYSILGRIIEVLTGGTWDAALADLLLVPLGLRDTHTLPEQVLAYRSAWGHESGPDGELVPAGTWGMPRSVGPAGNLNATATDVVSFARLHLGGGLAPDGTRLLSTETVRSMRAPRVTVPNPFGKGDQWGQGWALFDWGAYGHNGASIGQQATLRVVQPAGVAVALLANSERAGPLFEQAMAELLEELCGLAVPGPFTAPERPAVVEPAVLRGHTGVYERAGFRFTVTMPDAALVLRLELLEDLGDGPKDFELPLTAVGDDLFAGQYPFLPGWQPFRFERLAGDGTVLHAAGRATPKVG